MITFPSDIIPSEFDWGLQSNVQSFSSPLSGSAQTLKLPGDRWVFTFTYAALIDSQIARMSAFMMAARGGAERFNVSNPMRLAPTGAGGGTPVVAWAGQTGATLNTSGWPNSTLVLKVGDFFQVNGELKMVTADVTSSGTGTATIAFEPPLRAAPANLASIVTSNPAATFRLVENESRWTYMQGFVASLTINAVESWI